MTLIVEMLEPYSDRASILVIKQADRSRFRNPGLMRVPASVAIQGGELDCRNRTLHKMFRFAGIGEQAGSGIPTIFQGWKSQHWSPPKLYESREPHDQTVLELHMLQQLCQSEMLVTEGGGKGTVYFLPWQKLPIAEQVFGPNLRSSSEGLAGSSSVLTKKQGA